LQNPGNAGLIAISAFLCRKNLQNKEFKRKILQNKGLVGRALQNLFYDLIPQNLGFKALTSDEPTLAAVKYCQRRTCTQNILE
jgi:hypothetical protein